MSSENLNKKAKNTAGARANFLYGNMLDQMRYIEVLPYTKDQKVLDIACGIGWGSFIIGKGGASLVTGVDLSESALETARKYYSNYNIEFKMGNSKRILYEDNSFDVIVSFETLEHVENPQLFLDEIYRIGKPNARLFLSTPNAYCCKQSKDHKPENPFHFQEYYREELDIMLNYKWSVVKYKGQYPLKKDSSEVLIYRKWNKDYWRAQKLKNNFGKLGKIFSLILSTLNLLINQEPAFSKSCSPVDIKQDEEPAYHFFECLSKKIY